MNIGTCVSVSGAIACNKTLESITNNLANASTPGFKKEIPVLEERASPVAGQESGTGHFVAFRSGFKSSAPGVLKNTGNPLDLALEGEGYFLVTTPRGQMPQRDGRFQVSPEGKLVTVEGYPVQGENGDIVLTGGTVTVGGHCEVQVDGVNVDTIRIVDAALNPVAGGVRGVLQGYLEESNVQPFEEMVRMLEALRGYQGHIRMVQGFHDLEERTILELGRV